MKPIWLLTLIFVLIACSSGATASPTPFPTPDPDILHNDPIPEQVAFRGEAFLPLDLTGFLYAHDSPVNSRTLTIEVESSEHLTAAIDHGVLSVESTTADWYGTENVTVTACDDEGNCLQMSVPYSRIDESAAEHVRVLYAGNSGFLIVANGKKVLIDGMYGQNPQEAKSMYANSTPPFDNIDLILASHVDGDHFDPNQVRVYMMRNPDTVFISTSQSTDLMSGMEERIIAMDPALSGAPETVEVNGITVEALYISHGTPPAGMDEHYNNGYVVTIGDLTFFHSGDIDGTQNMLSYDLNEKAIDLAFIVHFYMRSQRDRSAFNNGIAASYYFPIHYTGTTPVFDAEVTRRAFPDAVIFNSVLQSWIMP